MDDDDSLEGGGLDVSTAAENLIFPPLGALEMAWDSVTGIFSSAGDVGTGVASTVTDGFSSGVQGISGAIQNALPSESSVVLSVLALIVVLTLVFLIAREVVG